MMYFAPDGAAGSQVLNVSLKAIEGSSLTPREVAEAVVTMLYDDEVNMSHLRAGDIDEVRACCIAARDAMLGK